MNKLIVGKTDNNLHWLPLWVHLRDTAGVMSFLLEEWVADATFESCNIGYQDFYKVALFVAYSHDIGKINSYFQGLITGSSPLLYDELMESGLHIRKKTIYQGKTPHSYAGQWILQSDAVGICLKPSIAAVVGAHHGKPYSAKGLNYSDDLVAVYPGNFYGEEGNQIQVERWKSIWRDVVNEALEISGIKSIEMLPDLTLNDQVILTGLLIMADWIASNTSLFPLISINDNFDEQDYEARIVEGWEKLHLPSIWHSDIYNMNHQIFEERFRFEPNDVQKAVIEAVNKTNKPGIFILEAQMGIGKTEAALGAAEVIASKCNSKGVFFGLPTQATANGLYDRLYEWAEEVSEETSSAIRLAHGGADYNEEYQQQVIQGKVVIEEDTDSGVYVHPWFQGNKKALLSDFVIGTVDQFLMASLRRRHFMLRHLGLSGKVVIIDECHAYDSYMNTYLDQSIEWMAGYGVPVILLSATLPMNRRKELVERYREGLRKKFPLSKNRKKKTTVEAWMKRFSYPMLTWTDGLEVHQINIMQQLQNRQVDICYLHGVKEVIALLKNRLNEGGCACVILNTIKSAQSCYKAVKEEFQEAEVLLYHAQFLMENRLQKEDILLKRMGKRSKDQDRNKFILIGTQVLEQSLDYDADIMITELCPVDLLLQRIGRLHRHDRCDPAHSFSRPSGLQKAECHILLNSPEEDHVTEYDDGSRKVYGDYLLMKTLNIMPSEILIPQDIPRLVQRVYSETDHCGMDTCTEYLQARRNFLDNKKIKCNRAKTYLLKRPRKDKKIQGILDNEYQNEEQKGDMSVRDIQSSIEIILMRQYEEDKIGFVYMNKNQPTTLYDYDHLEGEAGIKIARQRMYLPRLFGEPWLLYKVIEELENRQTPLKVWQQNPWLQGELILVLDSNNTTTLCGYRIYYDFEIGLVVDKEERDG